MRTEERRLIVRCCLAYLAVQSATIGAWATLAPRSWFRTFPGLGRHWVQVDGPYNHHLVSDVGALFMALTVLTVVAAMSGRRDLVRTAGGAWVVSSAPHLLYHVTHRAGLGAGDFAASLSGLALQVVLGGLCLVLAPADAVEPAGSSARAGG